MQLKLSKEIWEKIVLSYEGDSQVKRAKLQTLRIQYETLKMHNDESIASYFLRLDEVVNFMKNLGEDIKEVTLVEKVLRSLSTKFESKVSAIEEKQNPQTITMTQLHGILTAFEIRKGSPSYMREAEFKASAKGKEELNESGHILEEEDEVNFVKKFQWGSERFRDNDGLSNSDEHENSNNYRILMVYDDDNFWDALEEDYLHEEISKLKICLEEKNMIIDTLTYQLAEKEKHIEKLECEIVGLRKDIEKTKSLNLRFAKGSETLNEIIKVQHFPLIKIGLGYTEQASQPQKLSTSTKSYLDATKNSEQYDNRQQTHKADH
eukprot:PITA_01843